MTDKSKTTKSNDQKLYDDGFEDGVTVALNHFANKFRETTCSKSAMIELIDELNNVKN